MHAQSLRRVRLSVTSWTVARQAPLPVGFFRQDDWSGLPFPHPGDLPDPGVGPASPASSALAGGFFITESPGTPLRNHYTRIKVAESRTPTTPSVDGDLEQQGSHLLLAGMQSGTATLKDSLAVS